MTIHTVVLPNMQFCSTHEKNCSLPFELDSQLTHSSNALTKLSLSCIRRHVSSFTFWAKPCPADWERWGGLEASLTTADLPAPLQGKISYQTATALCPAVWGLCQGFLLKCTGVHQTVGGKQTWREEAWNLSLSLELSHVAQKAWMSSVKALIKEHFQAQQVSCVLWPNEGSVSMDTAPIEG